MTLSTTLFAATVLCFVHISLAMIPSLGTSTAQSVRSMLQDNDFRLRNSGTPQLTSPDFTSFFFDATNTPALAATDTQFLVSTTNVKAGRFFIKHYHPRAAEILYTTRGRFQSKFWFEGPNPRVVTNYLREGDSVVYPQGLVHQVKCISRRDCTFVAVLNSGDPGLIPVV